MEVIEYFSNENKEHWKEQIALADWGAAKFLLELLNDTQKFNELLGKDGMLVNRETLSFFA